MDNKWNKCTLQIYSMSKLRTTHWKWKERMAMYFAENNISYNWLFFGENVFSVKIISINQKEKKNSPNHTQTLKWSPNGVSYWIRTNPTIHEWNLVDEFEWAEFITRSIVSNGFSKCLLQWCLPLAFLFEWFSHGKNNWNDCVRNDLL